MIFPNLEVYLIGCSYCWTMSLSPHSKSILILFCSLLNYQCDSMDSFSSLLPDCCACKVTAGAGLHYFHRELCISVLWGISNLELRFLPCWVKNLTVLLTAGKGEGAALTAALLQPCVQWLLQHVMCLTASELNKLHCYKMSLSPLCFPSFD